RSTLLVLAGLFVLVQAETRLVSGQSNPLVDDRPVTIVRKEKSNRKVVRPPKRRRQAVVQKAPLLKLEWRVLRIRDDGSPEETSPLAVFHVGDRLRLAVKTNQSGYFYVIHQESTTQPGKFILHVTRVYGGPNECTSNLQI